MTSAACATIYFGDLWGYHRVETREATWEVIPYAQYRSAIRIDFIRRGKRKRETCILTSRPRAVILAGLGHPDPPSMYGLPKQLSEGTVTLTTRRLSCDPEWD